MIQEQQQRTNQWVLTPVQFNLVLCLVCPHPLDIFCVSLSPPFTCMLCFSVPSQRISLKSESCNHVFCVSLSHSLDVFCVSPSLTCTCIMCSSVPTQQMYRTYLPTICIFLVDYTPLSLGCIGNLCRVSEGCLGS